MQINKEFYRTLAQEKRQLIEKAYCAFQDGGISMDDFFDVCKHVLDDGEYNNLFQDLSEFETEEEQQEYINPNIEINIPSHRIVNEPPVVENYIEERVYENRGGSRDDVKSNKTNEIDDIIQYTGVDLKKEAENISRDIDVAQPYPTSEIGDSFDEIVNFFNIGAFSRFINTCCSNRNIKITEDAVNLIFKLLYYKIHDLIDKLSQASKIRIEVGILAHNVTAMNEQSKQLWFLNEMEKALHDKLQLRREENRQKRKNVHEREDLIIKKRQSNTVAMAAMGIKPVGWMKTENEKQDEIYKFESVYAPFDKKQFVKEMNNRVITLEDLIYALEKDKRYNKSIFLMQLRFLSK